MIWQNLTASERHANQWEMRIYIHWKVCRVGTESNFRRIATVFFSSGVYLLQSNFRMENNLWFPWCYTIFSTYDQSFFLLVFQRQLSPWQWLWTSPRFIQGRLSRNLKIPIITKFGGFELYNPHNFYAKFKKKLWDHFPNILIYQFMEIRTFWPISALF